MLLVSRILSDDCVNVLTRSCHQVGGRSQHHQGGQQETWGESVRILLIAQMSFETREREREMGESDGRAPLRGTNDNDGFPLEL